MSIQRAAILGALISGALMGASFAEEPSPSKSETHHDAFTGKALFVRLKNPGRSTVVLEDPQIQTFGENSFLIGRAVEGPVRSLRIWVPLSDVLEIEEFTDLKEMGKWYKLSPVTGK
jgi:hypothetical protein